NFNPNQPNVGIWGCDIKLKLVSYLDDQSTYIQPAEDLALAIGSIFLCRNLKLKRGALDKFRLPIDVVKGSIGRLVLTVLGTVLGSRPVKAAIDNIYLLAIPSSKKKFDPEDDERRKQATQMEKLENSKLLLSSTAGTPGNTSTEEAEKNESHREFLRFHPGDPSVTENKARALWSFAIAMTKHEVHQRAYKWTWDCFCQRRDDCKLYISLFQAAQLGTLGRFRKKAYLSITPTMQKALVG
ncbi:hypothetical protein O181_123870, partial [Austropuccinia psidii MF-1]|nr:hypothetical protein [Austropuccinia psidii MF-1]